MKNIVLLTTVIVFMIFNFFIISKSDTFISENYKEFSEEKDENRDD